MWPLNCMLLTSADVPFAVGLNVLNISATECSHFFAAISIGVCVCYVLYERNEFAN